MIAFLQITTLKVDVMVLISTLGFIIAFFMFLIAYNKLVKNTVNKKDLEDSKNEMKTYVDDKEKIKDKEIKGIYHHIQEYKDDNSKEHDRLRKEYSDMLLEIRTDIKTLLSRK